MSAELPTEEDVLAHLVPYGARPITTNAYSTEQMLERAAWNEAVAFPADAPLNPVAILAHGRIEAVRGEHPFNALEAAIADSERRLECERLEREIVDTVLAWNEGEFSGSAEGRLILWAEALQSARLRALEGK